MLKFIKKFFENMMFLNRIRKLEKINMLKEAEMEHLRLLIASQTNVITHLVKAYSDMYLTLSKASEVKVVDATQAEPDIDQMYKNFLTKLPNDDDLLN
jgi:Na+/phosphate symporter